MVDIHWLPKAINGYFFIDGGQSPFKCSKIIYTHAGKIKIIDFWREVLSADDGQ